MKAKNKIGRREFLSKATLAALTLPVMFQGGTKRGHAKNDPSSTTRLKEIETKMKRICIEEHWSNKELDEIGMQWRARMGFPPSTGSQTIPPSFVNMPFILMKFHSLAVVKSELSQKILTRFPY